MFGSAFSLIRSFLNLMDKERSSKQAFFILTAILMVALFPLIRANFSYNDDLGRIVFQYRYQLDYFGRYLSDFFSILIHADTKLSDISPLSQLIAVLILAFTGMTVIRIVSGKKVYSLWQIVATLPMFLSPYFLQCLSYKFDAPYTALSMLASILPMTLYRQGWKTYFPALICGTLVVCTTYQVSLAITFLFFVFLFFKQIIEGAEKRVIRKYTLISIAGIGVGLLFFVVFLMPETPDDPSYYVNTHLPNFTDIIQNSYKNFMHYSKQLLSDMDIHHRWEILLCFLIVFFMYALYKNSRIKNKKKTIVLTICLVYCMYLCSFGVYPLVKNPIFFPRSMYGIGAFVALLCLYLTSCQKMCLAKMSVLIFSWTLIVFSCVYGNALFLQKEYENFRFQMILSDLNSLEIAQNGIDKAVVFQGNIGYAPAIHKSMELYPVLYTIVPGVSEYVWSHFKFANYYGLKNMHRDDSPFDKKYPVLKDTMYHTITGDKDRLVIYLK